jgi:hypothetical protein
MRARKLQLQALGTEYWILGYPLPDQSHKLRTNCKGNTKHELRARANESGASQSQQMG